MTLTSQSREGPTGQQPGPYPPEPGPTGPDGAAFAQSRPLPALSAQAPPPGWTAALGPGLGGAVRRPKATGTAPDAKRAPSFFLLPSPPPPGSPEPLRRPRGQPGQVSPQRPTEARGRSRPSPLRDSGLVPRPHPPSVTAPSQSGGADQTNDPLPAAARARSLSRASAASRDPRSPHGRDYRPHPPPAVPAAATAVPRLSRLLTGGRPRRASPPPEKTYTKRFPIGSRFPT